jgi:N-methylhydantoinase B
VLDPIEFVIPETSILAAKTPKPVGGYTETILRLIDLVFIALAQATPERTNAAAYGTINALSLAGFREDGQRWVMFSFFGGGHGGHPEGDGLNHGNAPISTATIPPLEILEAAYPIMFRQWALRADSGGAGWNRGGLGAVYEIELLEKQANAFLFGERGRFAPPGVLGGSEGALNRFRYEQDDGEHAAPLVSKMVGINLARGQAVRLESPGGGGYGLALDREPGRVAEDVRLGYVTAKAARRDYGVVLDAAGAVDITATDASRRAGQ